MSDKKITWTELSQHNKANDCWFVIDNVIYNPTEYLNDHPGGPAVLQNRGGKDATRDFNETEFPSLGHTENARKDLVKYRVGVLDQNSEPLDWQRQASTALNLQQISLIGIALILVFVVWTFLKT